MPWPQLTEDLTAEIVERVKGALWPEIAAKGLGVRPQDWTAWTELGERLSEAAAAAMYVETVGGVSRPVTPPLPDDLTDHERLCVALVHAVDQAEAHCESRLIHLLVADTAAAKRSWRAALCMLERRFPERWGKQPSTPPRRASRTLEDLLDDLNHGEG